MNYKRFPKMLLSFIMLLIPSVIIYGIYIEIFKDYRYALKEFIIQLAFLPILYFFSTLIIDRIVEHRAKKEMMDKLNIVIGAFFSDIGTFLITRLLDFDPNTKELKSKLNINMGWSDGDFDNALKQLKKHDYKLKGEKDCLFRLKDYTISKRSFLMTLMQNQNLLEHESFTELILALFHLCEELSYREDLNNLADEDFAHLLVDIQRVYERLVYEWVKYMKHLKDQYPYLYSFSVRSNPFL